MAKAGAWQGQKHHRWYFLNAPEEGAGCRRQFSWAQHMGAWGSSNFCPYASLLTSSRLRGEGSVFFDIQTNAALSHGRWGTAYGGLPLLRSSRSRFREPGSPSRWPEIPAGVARAGQRPDTGAGTSGRKMRVHIAICDCLARGRGRSRRECGSQGRQVMSLSQGTAQGFMLRRELGIHAPRH